MSDMLAMPAIQIGNPIPLVILVIPDYWLIHVIENDRKSGDGGREEARERKLYRVGNCSVVARTKRRDPQERGEITA